MLQEKVRQLLGTLCMSVTDVARSAGCDPSNLNRIKNGARTPSAKSPTMAKFTEGVVRLAGSRGQIPALAMLLQIPPETGREQLRTQLLVWLYDSEDDSSTETSPGMSDAHTEGSPSEAPASAFGKRLDDLMKLAELTNRHLSRLTGIDASYISRLRRGQRMPKYTSEYLNVICMTLCGEIIRNGKLRETEALTGEASETLTSEQGPACLRNWLFAYGDTADQMAVDSFLETIISIKDIPRITPITGDTDADLLPSPAGITYDSFARDASGSSEEYGIAGLRHAVIQLLTLALRQGKKELLLYSDCAMDWMGGEFRPVLTALTTAYLRTGGHIRIIHNIDRSMTELFAAIKWWMPLYMTGQVHAYYSKAPAGERFAHTLFICPGCCCIRSWGVRRKEDSIRYLCEQDAHAAASALEEYEELMADSAPLVAIQREGVAVESGDISLENIYVRVSPTKTVIKRITDPRLSFVLTHPQMCRAFHSFFQRV